MTGRREWFSAREIAALPGLPTTQQSVNRKLGNLGADQRRKRQGRGGGWEYHTSALPPATQAALLTMNGQNQREPEAAAATEQEPEPEGRSAALWQNFERRPQTIKDSAAERLQVVLAVEQLIGGGHSIGGAVRAVAEQTGVSVATVQ
ncbi:MAG: DNA-binding protein, partial [Clostridia bacterium]|nr:DNA-binding protein [Clostridia bacterium]